MASTFDSADATDATSTIDTLEYITEYSATSNPPNKILLSEGFNSRKVDQHLLPSEIFWREQYEFLLEYGYTLRARYHPNWKPSWFGTSKKSYECEDGQIPPASEVMDASCPDGSLVMLKRIRPKERLIGEHLSQLRDPEYFPQNYCVPYLEVLEPPDCEYAIVVMPYLVYWETTPFETIGEVVEFFRQIFEGLLFMHDHNIAHEDITFHKIMADSVSLFSYPPHPSSYWMKRNFSGKTRVVHSRTEHPIKYYLTGFGLANSFVSKTEASEQPPFGETKNCPEVWQPNASPCNPFPVDVFCMGNVVHRFLFDKAGTFHGPRQGFEFMRELVDDMMNSNPSKRPSMKEVVQRYEVIYNDLSEWKLRSPVITFRKRLKFRKAVVHWTKQLGRMVRGISAIPRA